MTPGALLTISLAAVLIASAVTVAAEAWAGRHPEPEPAPRPTPADRIRALRELRDAAAADGRLCLVEAAERQIDCVLDQWSRGQS